MKAIVCKSFGPVESLSLETIDNPLTTADSVEIDVIAAGVNFPDGLVVQGKYQVKPEVPFIPGMELCGDVVATGRNVNNIKAGDRIIASSSNFGAYAEKICLPANKLVKIPTNIAPAEACNLLIAHGTAHHALKQRANIKPGEKLVVLGAAGGTGLAAVQIGKAMGAHVIDGHGADVIYDPVGGELFDASIRAMAPNGRFLVVGFASGTIPKFPVNLALVKETSLVGVFWGAFRAREPDVFNANMKELLHWYEQGVVSVQIDKTFTLAETSDAILYVMNRQAKGKVAVSVKS